MVVLCWSYEMGSDTIARTIIVLATSHVAYSSLLYTDPTESFFIFFVIYKKTKLYVLKKINFFIKVIIWKMVGLTVHLLRYFIPTKRLVKVPFRMIKLAKHLHLKIDSSSSFFKAPCSILRLACSIYLSKS